MRGREEVEGGSERKEGRELYKMRGKGNDLFPIPSL
jgi:hypothetical protein